MNEDSKYTYQVWKMSDPCNVRLAHVEHSDQHHGHPYVALKHAIDKARVVAEAHALAYVYVAAWHEGAPSPKVVWDSLSGAEAALGPDPRPYIRRLWWADRKQRKAERYARKLARERAERDRWRLLGF